MFQMIIFKYILPLLTLKAQRVATLTERDKENNSHTRNIQT